MEELNEMHLSHIGRVKVSFYSIGEKLLPERLSKSTGIDSDSPLNSKEGDKSYWMITSKNHVKSKDINEHFKIIK